MQWYMQVFKYMNTIWTSHAESMNIKDFCVNKFIEKYAVQCMYSTGFSSVFFKTDKISSTEQYQNILLDVF